MNDGDYNFRKTTTIDMPLAKLSHGGYELIDVDKDGDKDLILSGTTGSEYTNSNGEIVLIMNLGNYGSGYTGNSYFCRSSFDLQVV